MGANLCRICDPFQQPIARRHTNILWCDHVYCRPLWRCCFVHYFSRVNLGPFEITANNSRSFHFNFESNSLRRMTGKADPLLCAFGSLVTVPTLFILILVTRDIPMYLWWALTFVAISAMCLSWTVVADILLYTIHPTKRSIASAINILVCHLFGDAFSPYLIGAVNMISNINCWLTQLIKVTFF